MEGGFWRGREGAPDRTANGGILHFVQDDRKSLRGRGGRGGRGECDELPRFLHCAPLLRSVAPVGMTLLAALGAAAHAPGWGAVVRRGRARAGCERRDSSAARAFGALRP